MSYGSVFFSGYIKLAKSRVPLPTLPSRPVPPETKGWGGRPYRFPSTPYRQLTIRLPRRAPANSDSNPSFPSATSRIEGFVRVPWSASPGPRPLVRVPPSAFPNCRSVPRGKNPTRVSRPRPGARDSLVRPILRGTTGFRSPFRHRNV